ncbi:MAG: NAD(P)-dependent oxidoreductase [bacterium]
MPLIVVPDDFPSIFSGTTACRRLADFGELKVYTEKAADEGELKRRVAEAEVIINIRAYSKFTAALLQECPKLKLISVLGIGTDNIDLQAASRLGIKVCNTPGYSAVSVAEHTLALMLAAARQISAHDRELRAGRWVRLPKIQLHGKTLGIIGWGDIARQLASLAAGIGMKVLIWTFHPQPERLAGFSAQFVELEKLLREADVISINIRASEKTRGLLSRAALAMVKPSAILVNTARASIVDTPALIEALSSGKLAAAALDVFDQEPLPFHDPLLSLPNVVLSPHNAGMTPEAIAKGNQMVVENVISFLKGKPLHVVN